MAMACSTRMLAPVLLVLAFTLSATIAESGGAYQGSAHRYACILTQENFPLASKGAGLTLANGKLCVLCEQYSTEALVYLRQNETQTEILSVLHHTCASLGPLRQQCMTLVDYYIPAFFLEVSVVKPEELCESAHLCPKGAATRSSTRGEACGLCHHVLVEVLTMLKDPNTKLEIVGLLFKTCSKAKNYEPQCKRLVLDYVPLIMVKTQKFLETTDVCFATHACKTGKTGVQATTETIPLSATL